jgi:CubicO group peptidase (beta-lactamase class C family)
MAGERFRIATLIFVLGALLAGCGGAPVDAPRVPSAPGGVHGTFDGAPEQLAPALRAIDGYARRLLEESRTPGASVALTSRDGWLWQRSYGVADRESGRPVDAETLFQVGSISKTFTAVALLDLREEGRFDPQAEVTELLPWFAIENPFEPLTAHHLLTHTAGLPANRDDVPGSEYMVYALRERQVGYPPGEHFAYSNIGYQVLSAILETLDRRPVWESVGERIFEPLGMASSRARITLEPDDRTAVGYQPAYDDRPPHRSHPLVPSPAFEYAIGDGNVLSTATDLAAFLRMLLRRGEGPSGELLTDGSFELLLGDPEIPAFGSDEYHYGYGVMVRRTDDGHTRIQHSGGMLGFVSDMVGDLDTGYGAVALVNALGSVPMRITAYAVDALNAAAAGEPIPDPPPPPGDPFSIGNAADYAGVYRAAAGDRELHFTADGDRLYLDSPGWELAEPVPVERYGRAADALYARHPDLPELELFLLRFARDGDGDEDGRVVELFHGPDRYLAAGYDGPVDFPLPESWHAYPGHYRSYSPWLSNFRVVLRKGELMVLTAGGPESTLGATPLAELEPGLFRVGEEPTAERLRFDAVVEGHALRATWSGHPFYRTFSP